MTLCCRLVDLLPGPGKASIVEFTETSQHGLSVVLFPASSRIYGDGQHSCTRFPRVRYHQVALGTERIVAHASQVRLKITRCLAYLIRHLTLIQIKGFQAAHDRPSLPNP